MDSTVIATALPAIAADLGVGPITLKLALTAYMVALAIFIPISGWMADRFGAKKIFRLAIFVFTIGSLFCANSNSLVTLRSEERRVRKAGVSRLSTKWLLH